MTEQERKRLGRHIAKSRKDSGWSLRDLAGKTGISRGSLSEIENGLRLAQPETLRRIASALEVDWEDLYALAGYGRPETLPSFGPYLRSKYGDQLSAKDLAKLEKQFREIAKDLPEGK